MCVTAKNKNTSSNNTAGISNELEMEKNKNMNENMKKEILINNTMYDVTNFKHPGGSIIKFLINGGDATEAYREFHGRSKKANKYLKALPNRELTDNDLDKFHNTDNNNKNKNDNDNNEFQKKRENYLALSKDYETLRLEFEKEGRFKPNMLHVIRRFMEVIVMYTVGIYLFKTYYDTGNTNDNISDMVLKYMGFVIMGIVCGRCGWLMHEGGHYSLTGDITTDRALQIITYGLGCGMSAAWWRNQHNKHHATPQKLKHDVDLDTLPLMAFHATVADKAKNPFLKMWLKVQAFCFFPISCTLVGLGWQFYLHPRHILRIKHTGEAAILIIRYWLWFGFITSQCDTWSKAWLYYVAYTSIASSYIFLNFALSHTHLPITQANEFIHWVEYSAYHTTNISTSSRLCTWWMAHLNYQIEHHLFPSMPQFQHPFISQRVQTFFAKHNLPYGDIPYFEAVGITLKNLHDVGNHSHDHQD